MKHMLTPSRLGNIDFATLGVVLREESSTCVIGTSTRDGLHTTHTALLNSRAVFTKDQLAGSLSVRGCACNRKIFMVEVGIIEQDSICLSTIYANRALALEHNTTILDNTFFTTGRTYGLSSSVRNAPTPTLIFCGWVSAL